MVNNLDRDRQINRLLQFLLQMPMPNFYRTILREQVSCSSVIVEEYVDCLKILFEDNHRASMFPLGLPTLLQGGQVLKDSGPISFHVFVEKGYLVQFELVDMGLNNIDWDYFWSHTPIYDVDYFEHNF